MLVLTRKTQERIQIGDNVTVTILRIKGKTVSVGIEAPRQVRVIRGELPKKPVDEGGQHDAGTLRDKSTSHREASADPPTPRAIPGCADAADPSVERGARRLVVSRNPLGSLVRSVHRTRTVPA